MGDAETHGLGYHRVDEDPNVGVLLGAMDATGDWAATRELRTWEREQLRLVRGWRLLDVGCGLGDAAIALAEDLGSSGQLVGVDASAAMIAEARARAAALRCPTRFEVGDALEIGEPTGFFDAVRSERTLQWLTSPQAAVLEMVRVLRGGGVLSLIDTDWSTLVIDVGDAAVARQVRLGLAEERHRPSNIGRRLGDLIDDAGLERLAATSATQVWNSWDPDRSVAPPGCFSMSSLADDLIEAGQLSTDQRNEFISTIRAAARSNSFRMTLTMYAVVARAPSN